MKNITTESVSHQNRRKQITTVNLDPEVKSALETIATQEDRSVSNLVNWVLKQYTQNRVKQAG